MTIDPPPPADLAYAQGVPCLHCGYDLRTIRVSAPCPECGKPAVDALHGLVAARRSDLLYMRSGLRIMLAASVGVPMTIGCVIGLMFLSDEFGRGEGTGYFIGFMASIVAPVATWAGISRMAAPVISAEPTLAPPPPSARWAGKPVVWAAGVHAAASTVWYVLLIALISSRDEVTAVTMVGLLVVTTMCWTIRNFFACRRMAGLLGRANVVGVRRWCEFLSWVSVAMLAVTGLIASLVLYVWVRERFFGGAEWRTGSGGLSAAPMLLYMIVQLIGWLPLIGWLIAWPITLTLVLRKIKRVFDTVTAFRGPLLAPVAEVDAAAGGGAVR